MYDYIIERNESRRYAYIKTLMCIFVLIIHSYQEGITTPDNEMIQLMYSSTYIISRIICDCAVPMFTMISAVLLYSKPINWKINIYKKIKTLLIPYVIFNTLWIMWVFIKSIVANKIGIENSLGNEIIKMNVYEWLDAYLGIYGDYKPMMSVLWYLKDLFLLNIIAIPIKKIIDKFPKTILIITLIIWLSGVKLIYVQTYSVVFFVIGYYMVKYNIHLKDIDEINDKCIYTIYVIVLMLNIRKLGMNIFINRMMILVSLIVIAKISKRIDILRNKIYEIMSLTMIIYLMHRFVYDVLNAITPDNIYVYLVLYICKPVIAIVLISFIYKILNKKAPKLLMTINGKRTKENTQIIST